jgi:RNA polymerase primary sigma factor
LVVSTAYGFRDQGVPLVDLFQEGNLGLLKAVERFDYRQGNKFSTYAVWWIRQTITRALADQCRTIRVPVHMHDTLYKIHRAEEDLRQQLGRKASRREVAQYCEMSIRDVDRALEMEPQISSLDTLFCCPEFPLEWDDDRKVFVRTSPCPVRQYARDKYPSGVEAIEDGFECPPCALGNRQLKELAMEQGVDYSMLTLSCSSCKAVFDAVADLQLREELDRLLRSLNIRQRVVLKKRFGLEDGWQYTLEEIGVKFGLSRERIRQIETQALTHLQHPVRKGKLRYYISTRQGSGEGPWPETSSESCKGAQPEPRQGCEMQE